MSGTVSLQWTLKFHVCNLLQMQWHSGTGGWHLEQIIIVISLGMAWNTNYFRLASLNLTKPQLTTEVFPDAISLPTSTVNVSRRSHSTLSVSESSGSIMLSIFSSNSLIHGMGCWRLCAALIWTLHISFT